jgi:hypothetical protein
VAKIIVVTQQERQVSKINPPSPMFRRVPPFEMERFGAVMLWL